MEYTIILLSCLLLATGLAGRPRQNSLPDQYPFQASIQDVTFGLPYHLCGASVYDRDHVVTAAHCVTGGVDMTFLRVTVGDYDNSVNDGTEQVFTVVDIMTHNQYNTTTRENDIAILKISSNIIFNAHVVPINIPSESDELVGDCDVTGWGITTEDGVTPHILQTFQVPLLNDTECSDTYGSSFSPDKMLCAATPNLRIDSCSGMAGGPLTCYNGSGVPIMSGIVSGGTGCTIPSYPNIYTEVIYYADWLVNNTATCY